MSRTAGGRSRGDRGFTLIEVLAALVVFGFLAAGLAQAVRFGLVSWRVGTQTVARDADLDQAARVLRRILTEARAGAASGPDAVAGTAGTLVLTTVPGVRLGDPATEFTDASIGVEHPQRAPGRLLLRLSPHYHAVRIGPAPKPAELVLATGVASIRIGYFRRADHHWLDRWKAAQPPDLFRVAVTFDDPRRHWPPIVVAPMVSRSVQ